jgi:hypothetical protein
MGHTNFCPVWPLRTFSWNYKQTLIPRMVTVFLAETIDKEEVAHKLLPCLPLHRLWTFGDPFWAWSWLEKS